LLLSVFIFNIFLKNIFIIITGKVPLALDLTNSMYVPANGRSLQNGPDKDDTDGNVSRLKRNQWKKTHDATDKTATADDVHLFSFLFLFPLVHRSSIVTVLKLFSLAFFSAASARGQWKCFSTGGFIKKTASGNAISTGGLFYLAASGKVSRLFKIFVLKFIYLHTQSYIYIDIDKHVVLILKATWN
jgi:hypothetical protein